MEAITNRYIVQFKFPILQGTNGYCVYKYTDIEHDEDIILCGTNLPNNGKLKYEVTASCVPSRKYKVQRNVLSCDVYVTQDGSEIVNYLSSGIFKGVGRKTAEKIYKCFKSSTLDILKNDIDRLSEVKGVSKKMIANIKTSYESNRAEIELNSFLGKYQFSPALIHKIAMKYKDNGNMIDLIKENPYSLCSVHGITFDMIEPLYRDFNIADDEINRVWAAAVSVIQSEMKFGHVGVENQVFSNKLIAKLNSHKIQCCNDIQSQVVELIKKGKLSHKCVSEWGDVKDYFYLKSARAAELSLAENIAKILASGKTSIPDMDDLIRKHMEMNLDSIQLSAVKEALQNNLTIITGGPGTGKTTIIKMIGEIFEDAFEGKEMYFLAPTNKAARRITESTTFPASTIHSCLKLAESEDGAGVIDMDRVTLEDALVVVDEVSMLDLIIADELFSHMENCKVVFVGDIDQLPSVGPGAVLRDMMNSGVIPTVKLINTYRQDKGSLICDNAKKIREGHTDLEYGDGFEFSEIKSVGFDHQMHEMEDQMIEKCVKAADIYGVKNIMCLCPYKSYPGGVYSMNKRLQEIFNPPSPKKAEYIGYGSTIFRVGDPVMQLKNKEHVANGDIGEIISIGYTSVPKNSDEESDEVPTGRSICVKYPEGHLEYYSSENIDEIMLAYATTVHKAQGSEAAAVVTCLCDSHQMMLKRNLIYTAITRAKETVYLCGSTSAIRAAILNDHEEPRNTLLAYEIKQLA